MSGIAVDFHEYACESFSMIAGRYQKVKHLYEFLPGLMISKNIGRIPFSKLYVPTE